MIHFVRRAAQPLLDRVPRLRSLGLDVVDWAARLWLWPFRLPPAPVRAHEERDIEARTDELNRAAEAYFAQLGAADHLLDKPFSEADACARRLIAAGVLIDALRLQPGDTVLELGAGTCWLSHFLNRYGCRTLAVDVSPTALAIGRRVFESDARTRWQLQPEFLAYDGHILPLADGSVDRIVICDAFHHLPNASALLREMRRVLTTDGIVAMSEPGRGHADAASSVAEAATGVLEHELSLEHLAESALVSGFRAVRVVLSPERPIAEVDARDLRAFTGGRGFARYWRDLRAALDGHHFVVLFAGDPQPTPRRPRRLKARVRRVDADGVLSLAAGTAGRVTLDVDKEDVLPRRLLGGARLDERERDAVVGKDAEGAD